MRTGVLAATLAAGLLAAAAPIAEARHSTRPDLVLAVLPCANIETTFRKFYPLLSYLKSVTGLSVKLTLPADLTDEQIDDSRRDEPVQHAVRSGVVRR